jgi:four helix bundle protein
MENVCMKENAVGEKSMLFAVRIVNLYRHLLRNHREHVLAKQVLRSGASIGANVREAESAQSKPDFLSKMSIALKECGETAYWLELLMRTDCISQPEYDSISTDCGELFALLTAIIKSSRRSMVNR